METPQKKLLLIGAKGWQGARESVQVRCVSWDKVDEFENPKDFDFLVLNLLSLNGNGPVLKVDWKKVQKALNFAAVFEVLFHQGMVVVIGDPRFAIAKPTGTGEQPFLSWTGLEFSWDSSPGDTVEYLEWSNEWFKPLVTSLAHWDYSLAAISLDEATLGQRLNSESLRQNGTRISTEISTICRNRYKHDIVFKARLIAEDRYNRRTPFGPIVFIPRLNLDEGQTLRVVLRELCDVETITPEPEWIASRQAPGQLEIDDAIVTVRTEITRQEGVLRDFLAKREAARRYLKLLYEREFALEPLVRDVLRELGASVEDPVEKNKEDGWLTVEVDGATSEAVLEIKSTKNDQVTEDGRKQVLDWIDRGITQRGKKYKGLFVGNAGVGKPLDERDDPFSDSWKKAAALSGICALTSVDLYHAYELLKAGQLDTARFWKAVFATNGIFTLQAFLNPAEVATQSPPA